MKKVLLASCAVLLLSTVALAQDVTAPIHQLLDGFNTNDMKAVVGSYATGDISITDEVPPFHWSGAKANDAWLADLEKHDKAEGVTDAKVKYSAPVRSEIAGDAAYVVVPVVYDYKAKGKPMTETARMTFVLHKESGAWKIAGWVWSGTKPHSSAK